MTRESRSPSPRRFTAVGQVCQEYLDRNQDTQKGRAWPAHRAEIAQFIAAKGDISVDDLIGDDLEKWIEDHKPWKSDWTRLRVARSIKRPFSWAWKKGLI